MIIGLTGRNASGKTEVAQYLGVRGFEYHSLSDEIRDEIRRRGREITREILIEVGNELRAAHGAGVLAERILKRLGHDRNYVVDSIRNPTEVEVLRRRQDFTLLAVQADPSVRFERSKLRGREGAARTLDQFIAEEAKELSSSDPTTQQLIATQNLSDIVVQNDGSITDLHRRLDEILPRLMSNFRRPEWDEYFMNIAKVVASRSNCIKRKVAAIIVKDRRVISTGYNGTPKGARNCNEGGCPRCNSMAQSGTGLEECLCCHGEENAITQAAYHGTSLKGATLYTTFAPCLLCTKMIINSGIREVVYNQDYPLNERALMLLRECGIVLRLYQLRIADCGLRIEK
ncbi:MAG TPA: deaminase [Acidobacteriota bacterium]|nr:deaminase [Acidobacteriota bacterium]